MCVFLLTLVCVCVCVCVCECEVHYETVHGSVCYCVCIDLLVGLCRVAVPTL